MADTFTVSGSALNGSNILYLAGGTGTAAYNSTAPGFAALSTGAPGDLNENQALVGFVQDFGKLSTVSMSFTVLDQSGVAEQPYAAFKIYAGPSSTDPLLVISLDNSFALNSSTPIHVFDQTTGNEAVNTTWGETLADLYSQTYSNGAVYGNLDVQRAYVYIGAWDETGAKTADIGSITVNTQNAAAPLPASAASGGVLLAAAALFGAGKRRAAVSG